MAIVKTASKGYKNTKTGTYSATKSGASGSSSGSSSAPKDTVLRSSSGASYDYATGERGSGNKYSAEQAAGLNSARERNIQNGLDPYSGDGTLDANALGSYKEVRLPQKPVGENAMSKIYGGNAGLADPSTGVSTDAAGNLIVDNSKDPFQSILETYLGNQPKMPSAEETYNSLPEKKALERASRDVNSYASQINNITAQAQAESLNLEGQGRGITESIIGGQQAQISREAAIKALPLQALLANAQGNKELAQQQLDTVFKLKMEDAQAQYDYKSKVLGLVYDYATKAEQRKLDAVQHKEDQAFQRETLQIQQDHDIRMSQIGFSNQVALKKMDLQAEADKEAAKNAVTPLSLATAKGNVDLISGLVDNKKLGTAVGPNALSRLSFTEPFTGARSNVIAEIEQLTSQLSLDSLVRAKSDGATFGALSEGELKLLSSSATKLNSWAKKDKSGNVIGYQASETEFKKELDKINNYAKYDYLLKGGNLDDVGAVSTPDGKVAVRNSDGTYTILN